MIVRAAKSRKEWSRPRTVLHLGAHRTGSTRLQAILDDNRDVLAAAGIVALTPTRPGKRNSPTIRDVVDALPGTGRNELRRLLRRCKAGALLRALIEDGAGGFVPHTVIVADEAILGYAFNRAGSGLYRSARGRLAAFARLLGGAPSEIHLTVRSYDTFLVSNYAMKAVYGAKFPPFGRIRRELLAIRRGWPDLVADIARAVPGAHLRLTRVEQDPMQARVAELVGPQPFARFSPLGDERMNVAPTVEAMAAGVGLRNSAARDDLLARHATGTRFNPLLEEERAPLRQRYAEDLAALGLLSESREAGSGPPGPKPPP